MTTKIYTCELCKKPFDNQGTYWTHVNRKKTACVTNEQYKRVRDELSETKDELSETKDKYESVKRKYKRLRSESANNVDLKENANNKRISSFLILLMKKDPAFLNDFTQILKSRETISYNTIKQFVGLLKTDRYVPEKVKKQIYLEQEYKCLKCLKILPITAEVDHIIPLWQGGSNQKENLQGLCCTCHSEKTVEDTTKFYFDVCLLYDKIN